VRGVDGKGAARLIKYSAVVVHECVGWGLCDLGLRWRWVLRRCHFWIEWAGARE
jgi:hypothetical protein